MNQGHSEVRKFGMRDKFAYMLGDVGCNLVLTLANSYLLVFYTKVMGVSGAIVPTIFMLARFVDAFTDVAVGRMVDLHSDKHGDRFRPWMVYGSVPLVICRCLMYNYFLADAAMGVKVAWLVVTYLLFGSVCYTAVNIPYGAMSNVITADSGERAEVLSTWRNVGAQVGGVIRSFDPDADLCKGCRRKQCGKRSEIFLGVCGIGNCSIDHDFDLLEMECGAYPHCK